VPIRAYLSNNRSFSPEDLDAMGEAFEAALVRLGLHDRNDAMVDMIARRIIVAAIEGERDPIKLTEIGAGGACGCRDRAMTAAREPQREQRTCSGWSVSTRSRTARWQSMQLTRTGAARRDGHHEGER
jgi:hypothetical protein